SACSRLVGAAAAVLDAGGSSAARPREVVTQPEHARRRKRPALEPGTVLGRTYVLQRLIGRGGMGEVYEAAHVRLSGRYAVKVLRAEISDDDDLLARFRREAEIT